MTTVAAQKAERERDLDRFLTFVDAIVAIAITLLVLPLVELTADLREDDSVGRLLGDHADELWSFALSFYVIARIWMSQHHAVASLLAGNSRIVSLLTTWTFTIVVLPFPTALSRSQVTRVRPRCSTSERWRSASSSWRPCARRSRGIQSSPTARRTRDHSRAW